MALLSGIYGTISRLGLTASQFVEPQFAPRPRGVEPSAEASSSTSSPSSKGAVTTAVVAAPPPAAAAAASSATATENRIKAAVAAAAAASRNSFTSTVATVIAAEEGFVVPAEKYIKWDQRILIIGMGAVGTGTLPLVLKHIDIAPERITVLTAPDREAVAEEMAARYGVKKVIQALKPDNYEAVLDGLVSKGDFVINVSVDVSSCAIIEYCAKKDVLYIDTVIEPWAGGYTDPKLTPSLRSNYAQREEALELRRRLGGDAPTAVLTHGANPGMVTHLMKQALLNIARDSGMSVEPPTTREGWGRLAQALNIKAVHIAEKDTQISNRPKVAGEFVNTWSIDGFISEGGQPAELGWGSHEKGLPEDGAHHEFGCDSAIYLNRPGATTRVRTWAPTAGQFHGYLVTHNEAISISDYFTLKDGSGDVVYRPTCHYSYHPCGDAMLSLDEWIGSGFQQQPKQRLLTGDMISEGVDELGVLLMGNERGAYWYGSQLDIARARKLADYNTATTLQVTSAVLAGTIWAMENPRRGIVEPEEMDFERILGIMTPYVLPVVGVYTDWNPVKSRGALFKEDIDLEDPWQFKNFRVL